MVVPFPVHFLLVFFFILFVRLHRACRHSRETARNRRIIPDPPYLHSPYLFSVHPSHAIISNPSNAASSAVRIPIQWCHPNIQRSHKAFRRTARSRRSTSWILFGLLAFSLKPATVYSLPGTPHALVTESSLDSFRQQALRETVMNNITSRPANAFAMPSNSAADAVPDNDIQTSPFCFIADTDSVSYVLDTGANRFIVNDVKLLSDFQLARGSVKGVGGNPVLVGGTGSLRLPLQDDDGSTNMVTLRDAVYVPTSPFNLIPPQMLAAALKEESFEIDWFKHNDTEYVLSYSPPSQPKRTLTVPLDSRNMFSMRTETGYKSFMCQACHYQPEWRDFAGSSHVIPDSDDESSPMTTGPSEGQGNPREPALSTTTGTIDNPRESLDSAAPIPFDDRDFNQDERAPIDIPFDIPEEAKLAEDPIVAGVQRKQHRLAVIHERFGHLSFAVLKLMARAGLIPRDLANVDAPVCPGCAYGKAHRKPWRRKGAKNRRKLRTATSPGQVVSVDQLVSPTPGFVPTHRGIPTTKRYIGATVFVDHYSDFTYVHLMTNMDGESTVDAKMAFERVCESHGVNVSHYHADNGLFDTKVFKSAIVKAKQTLSFCGVNAHHQNGKAENRIKDVTQGARTALLHAAHRWPKAINASLWPAALKNYVNLRNALPTRFVPGAKQGKRKLPDVYDQSPVSRLSGTEVESNLDHFHPFGSPVYVLKDALQAQNSHNKWTDRSRVGIFLCHSPHHATDVPLVLNTSSGNVSPQFHCLYDDAFATCKRDAKFESLWQYKAKLASKPYSSEPTIDVLPTAPDSTQSVSLPRATLPTTPNFVIPWDATDEPAPSPPVTSPIEPRADPPSSPAEPTAPPESSEPAVERPIQRVRRNAERDAAVPVPVTRSGRNVRRNPKYFPNMHANSVFLETFSPGNSPDNVIPLLQPENHLTAEPHPLALISESLFGMAASSSDPDTMTLDEALRQPDRDEFIKAMHKELGDHVQRKHWKVVPLRSVPKHKRPLPMVWSMKRKRDPIGNITKWKARLCAGGHRSIESVDYWATYSPVVSWSTVRLVIVFAILNNWYMQSIDFVLAFPQAPVKTDIFMRPPKVPSDFTIPDLPSFGDRFTHVYQLIKNLYGLKDAGKTWFDFLQKGLVTRGWKPSSVDSCLFTKPGIILVIYVDDAILISPDQALITKEIKSLQQDYSLTDEGVLQDYLGTRFNRGKDGSVELSQPRMISRILEMVGIDPDSDRTKMHDTPASDSKLLDKDPNGIPRVRSWSYRSVVGSLSYLQAMVRPDITMAVQQCARFCNDPKKDHEEAVKRICRYLLKTKDRGLIMKPDASRGLECYVDADWAGSWQDRSSHDPLSAHSRTGYVIMYAGCPIVWGSKMQNLISLSTTEAEYIALSSALREVISIMNLMNELKGRGFTFHPSIPQVRCRVFEDNQSCIEIATNHRTRPRTKHLSVRLHHFRSHVVNKTISIQHISTHEQIADMFTKPLARVQFEKLRDRLMGWSSSSAARE